MLSIDEKIINKPGYRLHIIQTNKFKTIHLAAKYTAPIERKDVTKRALLPFVLQQGSKTYPTSNLFRRALDDLYGASFSMESSKKGETNVMTARMTLSNPSYLSTEEPIFEKALDFFTQALFDPRVVDGGFDATILKREKQSLKQKIEGIIDNKMHYANMRMIDEMCKDEPYHIHVHGYPEDFDEITPENLYAFYQDLITKEPLDLYLLGDFSDLSIEALIGDRFNRETAVKASDFSITPVTETKKKEIIEKQDIQQGKLHFGLRTHTTYKDQDYPSLQVFNAIFGGFPSSKLFINVREKNSLAYYAASRFESLKGLLFIFSGIAPEDYEKAHDIILEQLSAMCAGDFTESQIAEAKRQLINEYKETLDDAYGIIEVLFNQQISGQRRTVEAFVEAIDKVTHADIKRVANKITLDTTYFLTREEGNDA